MQGLRKCKWDNPNTVNPKVLRDAEPGELVHSEMKVALRKAWRGRNLLEYNNLRSFFPLPTECEGNFALEYTCTPGGKKHSVFGPHTATYLQVPIDCSAEVAEAIAHPNPLKSLVNYNPAPQVDVNIYEGTRRRENSFMTPELQRQKDESTLPRTGDMKWEINQHKDRVHGSAVKATYNVT